jgi:hypothetical protein
MPPTTRAASAAGTSSRSAPFPIRSSRQLLPYMNRTFGNSYFLLGADRAWPHKMFEAA